MIVPKDQEKLIDHSGSVDIGNFDARLAQKEMSAKNAMLLSEDQMFDKILAGKAPVDKFDIRYI